MWLLWLLLLSKEQESGLQRTQLHYQLLSPRLNLPLSPLLNLRLNLHLLLNQPQSLLQEHWWSEEWWWVEGA